MRGNLRERGEVGPWGDGGSRGVGGRHGGDGRWECGRRGGWCWRKPARKQGRAEGGAAAVRGPLNVPASSRPRVPAQPPLASDAEHLGMRAEVGSSPQPPFCPEALGNVGLGEPPPRWMDLGTRRVVVRTLRPGAPACSRGVGGPGRGGEVPAGVGDPRRGCRPAFGWLGAGRGAAGSRPVIVT